MAQLVEYDLAKVGVAGSSPVSRSGKKAGNSLMDKEFQPFVLHENVVDSCRQFTKT